MVTKTKQAEKPSEDKKQKSFYTPVGYVKFPKTVINDKEYGFLLNPKDLREDDVFSCKFTLVLDPQEPAVAELMALLDEQHGKIKNANFKPYKDDKKKDDNGDIVETGLIGVNFTTSFPIAFVDGKKQKCDSVQVGWGSKVAVKFNTKAVNNKGKIGLGRYVRAVQIIELKESGQDVSGFGEHEEGYAATPSDTDQPWEE